MIWETATNNDGRCGDGLFMTPSRDGQTKLLERAYRGREPLRRGVDYVEAHGTGTPAGDPVEIAALSEVLTEGVDREEPLWVGSVKSNIGHTEGAAGLAGLIRAVLVLEHGLVPRTLHFEEPNPDIPWEEIDVRVPADKRELSRDRPRVAAVNSFGITGTNAHVVLEQWREHRDPIGRRSSRSPEVLPVSGHTPGALDEYADQYAAFLRDDGSPGRVSDVE
ncbi:MAG: ketoacyl-synthetase C-terminal extension domain-containing protein, partial [Bradymonadaceae bacterium]